MKKFRLAAIVAIAAIMSLVAVTVISGDAGSQTTDPSDPNRGLDQPVGPEAPGGDDAVGTDDRDNGGDGGGALDQVIADDLIVDGSICAGFDCVNGESFGFDTLRLKENNLRIRFDDTSTSASFPNRDWQITINDTTNGGANKFSIDDITGNRTPFTIEAGAPTHSLFVDDGGRIGFGTGTPVVELHIKDGDTPTIRLEQDGSSGFTSQTWDVAGNEAGFFVRDVTNGSKLTFRIRPGAPTSSIDIQADGGVLFAEPPTSNIFIGLQESNPDFRYSLRVNDAGTFAFTDDKTAAGPAVSPFVIENDAQQSQLTLTSSGAVRVGNLETPPAAVAGGLYWDTTVGELCVSNGATWTNVITGALCS